MPDVIMEIRAELRQFAYGAYTPDDSAIDGVWTKLRTALGKTPGPAGEDIGAIIELVYHESDVLKKYRAELGELVRALPAPKQFAIGRYLAERALDENKFPLILNDEWQLGPQIADTILEAVRARLRPVLTVARGLLTRMQAPGAVSPVLGSLVLLFKGVSQLAGVCADSIRPVRAEIPTDTIEQWVAPMEKDPWALMICLMLLRGLPEQWRERGAELANLPQVPGLFGQRPGDNASGT